MTKPTIKILACSGEIVDVPDNCNEANAPAEGVTVAVVLLAEGTVLVSSVFLSAFPSSVGVVDGVEVVGLNCVVELTLESATFPCTTSFFDFS